MTKNICIISPSLKLGGIERALTVLANYFVQKGYGVCFISAQKGERFYELDARIHFVENPQRRDKGIFAKVHYYFSLLIFLRRTVTNQNPDVVLSFGDAFNPLVLLSLIGTKFPVFISDRTSPDFPFNFLVKVGKRLLYPFAKGFIAQTEQAAVFNRNKFANKLDIKVIPNALKDIQKYSIPQKKQIVCIGRLSLEKGQDRLIQAFSKVSDSDWQLVLAGDGPKGKEWEKLAIESNSSASIHFLGNVKNVDLLLSESSIFVLPSRLEGFPNALCEAMAIGLPCVCFDSIPSDVFIQDGINGIIVSETDGINGLSIALQQLMQNSELRLALGKSAHEIQEKLNINTIGTQFLSFMFPENQ